ncbi:TNFAIP3-interacting protein 3 isoform X3 [Prionailurus viverrinus]|uniref:TNFAIP3-interacting protein 3 isoform X3 n=1 Tax=Prionailurus viverrinus TaxID=61388 RepID=UPI001FF360C9|nr:TNFAIP3-interacting protein 3 isoform X3 [Prionailurus viverrinus]
MFTNQQEDSERCESMELDNKIRDLIERNDSPDLKGATPGATPGHRNSCSLKTPGKTASMAYCLQGTTRMSAAESSSEHGEHDQSSSRKNLTSSLEQKIRCLEKQRKEKEKESLSEELHELKKENKLLKEKNTLASKKKEQYECEIKRLNKALQDALKIECSSFPEDCLGKSELECRHKEMRTEMEVLKQQVQIYEEDFKKERSDRERLNQEKETLQKIIQTSQSELNRLNSQIKACQMEKEKLEKQLKQFYPLPVNGQYYPPQMYFPICNCGLNFHLWDPCTLADPGTAQDLHKHPPDYQWYAPDQFPPDVQHKANGFSSEKKVNQ